MNMRRDMPILGIVGFNLLTLLVYVTAPVQWQFDKVFSVCAFVLFCLVLVVIGYGLGQYGGRGVLDAKPPFYEAAGLIRILFPAYVLTFPVSYAYRLDLAPFDLPGLLSRLVAGLQDPTFGYSATLARSSQGSIPWTVYFVIAVFNQLFFAVGFLQWRHLRRGAKLLFAVLVGIEVFYWVGTATSFGVIALTTTWALSAMFWDMRGRTPGPRRAIRTLSLLALLLVGSVAFFSYNLYRRSNYVQLDVGQFENLQTLRVPLDPDHPAFTVVPEALWPTYLMVVSYMAQGYHHLSFAFDLDFRSSGMLGNNPALVSLAGAFGISVWDDTYMHRLHPAIDEFAVWHSAYMWYASDVSFLGVPVLLFLLGYLFGFSWALGRHGDFLSRVMFLVFGNMLLFLFANNTYLASVFYACMVFVPLWLFTRVAAVVQRSEESSLPLGLRRAPGR